MKVKICIADTEKYSEVDCYNTNCKWNMTSSKRGPRCAIKRVYIGMDGKCKLMQSESFQDPPTGQADRTGGR